ncbi:MAG: glycosyltransferase family 4 protein [bacterium]
MNLLLVNFVTDELHGVLAWQARVVKELAARCSALVVFTSRVGTFDTPSNVSIYQVPRRPIGVPHRFGGRWLLNWSVCRLCRRHRIDAVFIHMDMEWSYRLYPCFALLGLPVVVWYAHGTVSRRLRWAVRCADRVLTSSSEGCRIDSPKVRVIGQGVDTSLFRIPVQRDPQDILYVGRISPRKRVDLLVRTMEAIRTRDRLRGCRLKIAGPMLTMEDVDYGQGISAFIWERGIQSDVDMVGYVPLEYVPRLYRTAFLHLNVSRTNSMDKTVLEALSSGCPVLTTNPAFRDLLTGYPEFFMQEDRPEAIAERVEYIYGRRDQYDPVALRGLVKGRHDLHSYAVRVIENLQEVAG